MTLRILIFILLLKNTFTLYAQIDTTLQLSFIPNYNNKTHNSTEAIHLQDSAYFSNDNYSITITTLKFYISGIVLYKDGTLVWKEANSYHLIDASNEQSLSIPLSIPKTKDYNTLTFNIGIDSATNVLGVQGGDLDPMRGMYWTWQSGYINFKLEGTSTRCNTRHHAFEFHIGGYHYPYNTLQPISLPVSKDINTVVYLDVSKLLSTIDLSKTNQIMTPGKDALWIAEQVKKCFYSQLDIK
jgi:hypothetical protein